MPGCQPLKISRSPEEWAPYTHRPTSRVNTLSLPILAEKSPILTQTASRGLGNGTFCRISQGPPVHLFHRPPTPGETGTSSSPNPQPAVRCHAAFQFPDSLQDELRDAHRLPFPQCSGCNPLADKPDFSGTGSRPTHTGPEPIPNTQNYQLPRTSRNS